MMKNPEKGFCQPEDLDYEGILEFTKPYLGEFISKQVDWSPLHCFEKITGVRNIASKEDVWQFTNFLVPPQIFQENQLIYC